MKTAALLGTLLAATAAAAAAPGEYRHPVAALPYAWKKPVIDGVVDDAEWQGALSHRALQTTGRQLSCRQARFWMMWDEENLYVAMRDPLRQGERPVNALRDREREVNVVFDDCYEIWVSVGATDPLTGQLDCMTQFVGTFSGSRYDVLHQPAVGNSRTSSYSTGWEPKNRLTPENEWEMELVIPRASLGLTKGPFHDGLRFRTLIARNYKRPWEQNSFEGTSTFAVPDTHSEFVMSKSAPALHLLGVGDAAAGTLGLRLAVQGQADAAIRWRYQSPSVTNEGTAEVKKGVYGEFVVRPDLDRVGPGQARITVTAADGAVLLDWAAQRGFGFESRMEAPAPGEKKVRVEHNPAATVMADRGDVLNLGLAFNPERDYARVFGDFINFDNRAAIREIAITVRDAQGAEIKRARAELDAYAYAKAVLHFDKLPRGTYTVSLECKDAAGAVLASKESTFAKEDLAATYPWWKTKRGDIGKVVAPWTPVTWNGKTFGVWGREMTVGPAGLPERVSTQGRELLAAPAYLAAVLADGTEVRASGAEAKVLFAGDHRQTVAVESKLGALAVRSEVKTEFDGVMKVAMTLTPQSPVKVKSLRLVFPFKAEAAEYVHAVTAEIRSGFWYGFTPQGKGKVWDSIQLGDKTMKVGTFTPYIWLGSPKGGLCWFADSDEGWLPSDAVPAVEIRRDAKGRVDLVFNLAGEEAVLDKPRTITFGLQASPVKPMHAGWREDNWWCGDTFKPYAHDQNLIFASTPFAVPAYSNTARQLVEEQHKAGKPAVPYFIHTSLPGNLVPEMRVFGEQWRTTVDDALCYRGSFNDYMIHNWSRWAEQYGIDGYYIDNMRPLACDNLEHGCGYRLPDGRIQPTFQMFDTRDYFLRSRAAFLEQRGKSKLVIHMTNSQIIPWVGPADVSYDGEHHVIYPEMGKDFMDFWSLERLRVDFPGQWGVAVNFMHEYQGPWGEAELHKAMRAYFAAILLHDALPTGNHNGHASHLIKVRSAFGIGADDVRFLPYWEESGLSARGADVKAAGWLRPDKLLLLCANFGEKQDAVVKLDLAALGWKGASLSVADPEAAHVREGWKSIPKTAETLKAEREAWEKAEAARSAGLREAYERRRASAEKAGQAAPPAPDLTPRAYKEQPFVRERFVVWSGSNAVPPKVAGAVITVPVERHDYRLLVVERK